MHSLTPYQSTVVNDPDPPCTQHVLAPVSDKLGGYGILDCNIVLIIPLSIDHLGLGSISRPIVPAPLMPARSRGSVLEASL